MRLSDFEFELPEALIALRPAEPRGSARLLHVRPYGGGGEPHLEDRRVADLPDLLRPGDLIVLNDTRVMPVHLTGTRQPRAPGMDPVATSFTLHQRIGEGRWLAFARPARRLLAGDRIELGGDGRAALTICEKRESGEVVLASASPEMTLDDIIHACGRMPLPPYIAGRRPADERDFEDYQTVYAKREGAIAAPTAGLHITPELIARLEARAIGHAFVTLHVGAGTFLPVKTDDVAAHRMHAEWGEISPKTAARIGAARAAGGRIVSCGTTALRLLETATDAAGVTHPFRGETDLFITPGYRFKCVDVLMTNFHLPRSTLFMLVCAFCGTAAMQAAYRHAIAEGYRFYSYGDSSLLERAP